MITLTKLYDELLKSPVWSPRGLATRETLLFTIDFETGEEFIYHPIFHDNREYVKRELEWYMKGKFTDLSIADLAKLWRDHITEGMLYSNYGGWLWGNGLSYRGFLNAVQMVRDDRDTRRAVAYIGANDLVNLQNRDIPCTNVIQFLVRGSDLMTIVTMRSQDAYFGLRNDLPAFWFMTHVFGQLTKSNPMLLRLNVGSFHVYDKNIERIKEALDSHEDIVVVPFEYDGMVEKFANELEKRL
jgi:hypothetical protein